MVFSALYLFSHSQCLQNITCLLKSMGYSAKTAHFWASWNSTKPTHTQYDLAEISYHMPLKTFLPGQKQRLLLIRTLPHIHVNLFWWTDFALRSKYSSAQVAQQLQSLLANEFTIIAQRMKHSLKKLPCTFNAMQTEIVTAFSCDE